MKHLHVSTVAIALVCACAAPQEAPSDPSVPADLGRSAIGGTPKFSGGTRPGGTPKFSDGTRPAGPPDNNGSHETTPPASPAARDVLPSASEPERAAAVLRVEVARDRSVVWIPGKSPAASPRIVFLPGLCSNAERYLTTFPEAGRAAGGVLGLNGDRPCANRKDRYQFSWNAPLQHQRIEAALAALRASSPDMESKGAPEEITLVGYSQGAAIAEQLAALHPERYRKFVLIGAPTNPASTHFRNALGFVGMSCRYDFRERMKEAAKNVSRLGIHATYIEMPDCTHGQVSEPESKFGETFRFLAGA